MWRKDMEACAMLGCGAAGGGMGGEPRAGIESLLVSLADAIAHSGAV